MSRSDFSSLDAVAWTALLTCVLIGALTLLHALSPEADALAVGGAVEVVLYGAASFWLVRGAAGARPRIALGLVRAPLALFVIACVLGASLHGVADLLQLSVERLWPTPEAVLRERVERLQGGSTAERASIVAFAVVLAPLAEEAFFRGALFARLAVGRRFWPVAAITSICFSLSHAEPRIWPSLLLVGFALSLVRQASGSILPGYLLHAAFNATTLSLVWSDTDPLGSQVPAWPLASIAALVSALLLLRLVQLVRVEVAPS
jgi:membrane protease YdiL (CAAX protease family)